MSAFPRFKQVIQAVSFLSDDDCRQFEPHLRLLRLDRRTRWLEAGTVARHIGFVHAGLLRVYYLHDGGERNTHFALENDFVTEYGSLLTGQPSMYHIEAVEDSELVVFDAATLAAAYETSHAWEKFGCLMAEEAYRLMAARTASLLFMDARTRYEQLLEDHPDWVQRIPLYHLASYLGIERESLSRIRRQR
ncbi:MAG: Crp/Fnr family transcriptional regulator [Bacteroidia bacterium]